jgi:hypothetical protein
MGGTVYISNSDVQSFTKRNTEDHDGILGGAWVILLFHINTIATSYYVNEISR